MFIGSISLVLVLGCGCICIMIAKEKAGKPMFKEGEQGALDKAAKVVKTAAKVAVAAASAGGDGGEGGGGGDGDEDAAENNTNAGDGPVEAAADVATALCQGRITKALSRCPRVITKVIVFGLSWGLNTFDILSDFNFLLSLTEEERATAWGAACLVVFVSSLALLALAMFSDCFAIQAFRLLCTKPTSHRTKVATATAVAAKPAATATAVAKPATATAVAAKVKITACFKITIALLEDVPQLVIMAQLGRMNLCDPASSISILATVLNIAWAFPDACCKVLYIREKQGKPVFKPKGLVKPA